MSSSLVRVATLSVSLRLPNLASMFALVATSSWSRVYTHTFGPREGVYNVASNLIPPVILLGPPNPELCRRIGARWLIWKEGEGCCGEVVGSTGAYDRHSGLILAAPDAMPRDPSTGAGSDSMPIPPNQVPIGNGMPIHLGWSSILIKLCDGRVGSTPQRARRACSVPTSFLQKKG